MMRIQIIIGLFVAILSATPSFADPMTEVVARLNALEKRNDQLAQENAALKQRVSRLEASGSAVMAQVDPEAKTASPEQTTITTAAVIPTSARYEAGSIARASQPEPGYTWTGAYFGVHGGRGSGDLAFSETVPTVPFLVETFDNSLEASGVVGGMQLGANKQFGNWVVGGELSVSGAHISGSDAACFNDPTLALDAKCEARVNWLVTGLARLGYAHDRWLVSGAAGWSVAGAEYDYVFDLGVPVPFGSNETLGGFTYGAGFNYALTRSVSLGVEYLRADLSAEGLGILGGKGERDLDLDIARAQLNVKLGD